jgi:NitT/TauT family transport system permease protein
LVILLVWQIVNRVNRPIFLPLRSGLVFFVNYRVVWLITSCQPLEVLASTFLAIVTAVPLGLILGQSKRMNSLLAPIVYLLYPIPKVVLVPVVLLFLGIGDLPKIVIIYLILFFQILVLVRDQAASLRPELILSVRSLGAGRRALFRFVYFPASLPAILTALRQSVGTAVAVLYVAELFATQRGLGYYIYLNGSTLFNYPAMYAGVVAMSLLGVGAIFAVDWLNVTFVSMANRHLISPSKVHHLSLI